MGCSPVSDGAAAAILSNADRVGTADTANAVRLTGFAQANDLLPNDRRDPTAFDAAKEAWVRALDMAEAGLENVDFAEVHDC